MVPLRQRIQSLELSIKQPTQNQEAPVRILPTTHSSLTSSLDTGAIVGGVVGGVGGLIVLAALLFFLLRKRRRSHRDDFDDMMAGFVLLHLARCLFSTV